jgi:hypothetical protein
VEAPRAIRIAGAAAVASLFASVALCIGVSCSSFDEETADGADARAEGSAETGADSALVDAADAADAAPPLPQRLYVVGGLTVTDAGIESTLAEARSAEIMGDGGLGPWRGESSLPENRRAHAVVVSPASRRLYAIAGGNDTGAKDTVFVATADADGRLSSWTNMGAAPARIDFAAVTDGRFIHMLGGQGPAVYESGVLVADVAAGSPVFAQTTALPVGRYDLAAARVGGFIVASGGLVESGDAAAGRAVTIAAVGANGSLGPWNAGPALPSPLFAHASVSITDGVFVVGGFTVNNSTAVLRSNTLADGGLSDWTPVTSLSGKRSSHCAVAAGNFIYAIGGEALDPAGITASTLDTIEVATVTSAGNIAGWSPATAYPIPIKRTGCGAL